MKTLRTRGGPRDDPWEGTGTSYRRSLAGLIAVCLAAAVPGAAPVSAASPVPLPPAHEFVVLADRPVCSLLGSGADAAQVRGQDGTASGTAPGRVFWTFGDSYVGQNSGGPNQPNGLGYGTPPGVDLAGNCVRVQHKRDGANIATPLLARQPEECAVWSTGMSSLAPPAVHAFYVPVIGCGASSTPAGVGLATFDGSQVPGFPSSRLGLIWPASLGLIDGAHPLTSGSDTGYLYIALHGPTPDATNLPFANTVRLARVANTASALQACVPHSAPGCTLEYWDTNTASWTANIAAADSLFTAELGMNGGVMLVYNASLAKWTATYATGLLFAVRVRTAPEPTGPWGEETLVSYCAHMFLPGFGYCYTGASHPQYDINGGNTTYVTMATNRIPNGVIDEYSAFLHEITIGKPVVQSASGSARRYRIGAPPAGFVAEGTAFYASNAPVLGFSPIYEWANPANGDVLLGPIEPESGYTSRGALAFYAPLAQSVSNYAVAYEPVYRWDKGAQHIYSALASPVSLGYTNEGVAFYTLCGDADADYLGDCMELNSGNDPHAANNNVDGDVLLDANGNPVINAYGLTVPLGNMQSVAQDNAVRRQDIDNCPLVNNPYQQNSDSGPIATGAPSGVDATRPAADVLGDACDADADNDGRTQVQEAQGCNGTPATNAGLQDTDGDRYIDGYECLAGSNPASAGSTPPLPAQGSDTDGDGISGDLEVLLGTNPTRADTDGDRLRDIAEAAHWGTDPRRADTDGDGCSDITEAASVNGDWIADATDRALVAQRMAPAPYNSAFDVDRNGTIGQGDVALVVAGYATCAPPRHIDRAHSQDGASAIVLPSCVADLDNSGAVVLGDLLRLAYAYNASAGAAAYNARADFDASGQVDLADLVVLAHHYNAITIPCMPGS